MKYFIYIMTIVLVFMFSCNRIRKKGHEIVDKTEQKVRNKTKDIVDNTFPHFDYDKADTKYNKKRFIEYLEVELTTDIKEIYCFGDFLGADYKVLFSFKCDSSTVQRIINKKDLKLTNTDNDNGLLLSENFKWWKKEIIKKFKPYKTGKTQEYWQYLWYDNKNKIAYYEVYSL